MENQFNKSDSGQTTALKGKPRPRKETKPAIIFIDSEQGLFGKNSDAATPDLQGDKIFLANGSDFKKDFRRNSVAQIQMALRSGNGSKSQFIHDTVGEEEESRQSFNADTFEA